MKRVYRYEDNESYWNRRWTDAEEDAAEFLDLNIYPICYAEEVISRVPGRILEVGCGLGRLVKHYNSRGRDIAGIDRSEIAAEQILSQASHLDIRIEDAKAMSFSDAEFDISLAFGVYHNLEFDLEEALLEFARVLKPGGHFVISMRPQNLEMLLNEYYWRLKTSKKDRPRKFHKLLVRDHEFKDLLTKSGLCTHRVHRARNMSILFRFPFLRDKDIKKSSETQRRSKGYRLNIFGRYLDMFLTTLFPREFCNVLIFQGVKDFK